MSEPCLTVELEAVITCLAGRHNAVGDAETRKGLIARDLAAETGINVIEAEQMLWLAGVV